MYPNSNKSNRDILSYRTDMKLSFNTVVQINDSTLRNKQKNGDRRQSR